MHAPGKWGGGLELGVREPVSSRLVASYTRSESTEYENGPSTLDRLELESVLVAAEYQSSAVDGAARLIEPLLYSFEEDDHSSVAFGAETSGAVISVSNDVASFAECGEKWKE
jgi:hypothetical protein